jgi:patatin-related protein
MAGQLIAGVRTGKKLRKETKREVLQGGARAAEKEPPVETEMRIAVVLYGGVSLAVYMHGVVQELLRLVRARRGTKSDKQSPYFRLLNRLKRDVTVDVIAGTSAGGINGVLLAKALATGVDLNDVPDLWREKADIRFLARHHECEQPEALLSGHYFLTELRRAFARLDGKESSKDAQERKNRVRALDLFVTTSDLRGQVWNAEDSRGKQIWGRNHAHHFHLKKRAPYWGGLGYHQNDFAGQGERLARICGATAAIPGVFPPVEFKASEVYPAPGTVDPRPEIWLHDGVVVDNRPFKKVMETIYYRSADGPVDRLLLYVEPNPEGSGIEGVAKRRRHLARPNAVESLLSMVTVPLYQSIHSYLQHLEAQQRRLGEFPVIADLLDKPRLSASGPAYEAYLALRLDHLAGRLGDEVAAAVRAVLADGTAAPEEPPGPAKADQQAREAGQRIAAVVRESAGANRARFPAKSVAKFLAKYDSEFYVRLFYYVKEHLRRTEPEWRQGRKIVWALLDLVRKAHWCWLHGNRDTKGNEDVNSLLRRLAGGDGNGARDQAARELLEVLEKGINRWKAAFPRFLEGERRRGQVRGQRRGRKKKKSLDVHLATLFGLPANSSREHAALFLNRLVRAFEAKDILLFPLSLAGFGERDPIDFYRISPFDSDVGPPGHEKIAGEELAHFGAFLDRRWRANDLLWGRIDTADILVDILSRKLPPGGKPGDDEALIRRVRRDLFRRILWEEREAYDQQALVGHLLGAYANANSPARRWWARQVALRGFQQAAAGAEPGAVAPATASGGTGSRPVGAVGGRTDGSPEHRLGVLLNHAELEELEGFLETWKGPGRMTWRDLPEPTVANAAVDLLANLKRVVKPWTDKVEIRFLRKLLDWTGSAVDYLKSLVRWIVPRPEEVLPFPTMRAWVTRQVVLVAIAAISLLSAFLSSFGGPTGGAVGWLGLLAAALLLFMPLLVKDWYASHAQRIGRAGMALALLSGTAILLVNLGVLPPGEPWQPWLPAPYDLLWWGLSGGTLLILAMVPALVRSIIKRLGGRRKVEGRKREAAADAGTRESA